MGDLLDEILDESKPLDTGAEDAGAGDDSQSAESSAEGDSTSQATEDAAPPADSNLNRLLELEKANSGLLGALQAERKSRQQLESKMSEVTGFLANIAAQRAQPPAQQQQPQPRKPAKIKVEIDEEGNAFVPETALDEILAQRIKPAQVPQEMKQLHMQQMAAMQALQREKSFREAVNTVVKKDESYRDAYKEVDQAFDWINERVIQAQESAGISGNVNSVTALKVLRGTVVGDEFSKKFPGMDFERVVRAYDSDYDLENALAMVVRSKQAAQSAPAVDPKTLSGLVKKPSSLGGVRNQKEAKITTFDTIMNTSYDEINSMSDGDFKKLMEIMRQEELKG